MFVLEYLFFLGIAFIVFWLVNVALGLVAALVITVTKLNRLSYVTTLLSGYVFVSLAVLVTLGSMHMNPGTASTLVLPIIGGLIVFMSLGQSAAERERKLIENRDYGSLPLLRYDGLFVIGLTVLFVVMLFVPAIAQNPLTIRLLALIDWAYDLRVVGWILRIGGGLFLLASVFQGFLLCLSLIGDTIAELQKERGESNWFQRHLNWTLVLGYGAVYLMDWTVARGIPALPVFAELRLVGGISASLWALAIMLVIWYLKQKGRSLWHLLWAIPLGLIPVLNLAALFCLRNKRLARLDSAYKQADELRDDANSIVINCGACFKQHRVTRGQGTIVTICPNCGRAARIET